MAGSRTCCCGCCTVRDGTKIIALICLVFGILQFAEQLYFLIELILDPSFLKDAYPPTFKEHLGEFFDTYEDFTYVYISIMLLITLINIILSGLLFYGAAKNEPSKCLPWLYFNSFFFILSVIICVVSTILLLWFVNFIFGLMFGCFAVCIFAIIAYLLNVVRQYMQEVR